MIRLAGCGIKMAAGGKLPAAFCKSDGKFTVWQNRQK